MDKSSEKSVTRATMITWADMLEAKEAVPLLVIAMRSIEGIRYPPIIARSELSQTDIADLLASLADDFRSRRAPEHEMMRTP